MEEILIDIVDFDLTEKFNIYSYLTSKKSKTKYVSYWDKKTKYLHRVIMERILGRKLSKNERVDHINNNGLDNRRDNLRLCTHKQNMYNQNKRKGTSKYKGVYYFKRDNKWASQLTHNYKKVFLGYYESEEDAARAYNKKAKELFGVFAKLNKL